LAFRQEFVKVDKSRHDLRRFDCGKPAMNQFLARFAQKNMALGLSSTWVQEVEASPHPKAAVATYYTLAMAAVHRAEIPETHRLPAYPVPVPVALLARLAVDRHFQGGGHGGKVLVYALRHIVRLCDLGLPAFGVVIDVLDDDALAFYRKFELFEPLSDAPMPVFVPMSTLREL